MAHLEEWQIYKKKLEQLLEWMEDVDPDTCVNFTDGKDTVLRTSTVRELLDLIEEEIQRAI